MQIPRIRRAPALALVLVLAVAPATARAFNAATAEPPCDHPCTHVADCPKVTCECAEASASGVAACDADKTHCCVSPATACERFCEVNNQTFTGRFTPEGTAPAPAPTTDGASASSPSCSETCESAKDCATMTCQCAHGTAADVAACDAVSRCCGSASVVCPHFCKGKKGKWTGKLAETPRSRPPSLGNLLEPSDLGGDDPEDDGLER